jgi:hypothetical protein
MDSGPGRRDPSPNRGARSPSQQDWRDTMLDAQALADRYVAVWLIFYTVNRQGIDYKC